MRRAQDVIGLPVLALDTGEELGCVRDILCDQEWRVLGVLLQEEGWFQSGLYIPLEKIHAVGEDCLTVEGQDAAVSMHDLIASDTVGLVTGKSRLKGKTVYTASGEQLGTIEDVYFSQDWEKLVAYELSNGWITDVKEGRKRLPAPPSVIIGENNLIVPDAARIQA